MEQGLELQHELFSRLSVTGSYYYGNFKNITTTVNTAQTPADFTAVNVFNPVTGQAFTIYNQTGPTRTSVNETFADQDRKNTFNSYSAEFRARLGRGATLFGGMTWERSRTKNCTVGERQNPNNLRFCDQFNLEDGSTVPYQKNFRLNGSYPLPWQGIIVSGTFQSNDGGDLAQSWTLARTTRYPNGTNSFLAANQPVPACPSPCVPNAVVISNLGQTSLVTSLRPTPIERGERLNQVDLKVGKTFRIGTIQIAPNFEIFHVNDTDKVITYQSTSYAISTGAYLKPNSVVPGRIAGVGTSRKWYPQQVFVKGRAGDDH